MQGKARNKDKFVCKTVTVVSNAMGQLGDVLNQQWLWILAGLAGPVSLLLAGVAKIVASRYGKGGGKNRFEPGKDIIVDPTNPHPEAVMASLRREAG